jgi:uncharacterized protein
MSDRQIHCRRIHRCRAVAARCRDRHHDTGSPSARGWLFLARARRGEEGRIGGRGRGLIALFALGAAGPAAPQQTIPQAVGYVNDFAGAVEPATEASIERIIEEVLAKSGGEIVVVTLPSLGGEPIDRLARRIGEAWRVGRKGGPADTARRSGLLVLLVPDEVGHDGRGGLWIATGLGPDTVVTAFEAERIADLHIRPAFADSGYGTGMLQGTAALAVEFAEHFGFELTGEPDASRGTRPRAGRGMLAAAIAAVLFVLVVVIRRRFADRNDAPA